ncbi:S8 family serine peptidase [Aliikangiella coralliicola]|uniref:S8 family serine peptidase n=1 Tax=Aliikangiella coralliicola TaxID=2592383 RepID=A0A545UEN9_9GAMM|nr:S8 family serine peptidase [Aliikangiella coralliicola]TQV87941.1 S8 family serine peptidase [Aliikangiella coralliicola]
MNFSSTNGLSSNKRSSNGLSLIKPFLNRQALTPLNSNFLRIKNILKNTLSIPVFLGIICCVFTSKALSLTIGDGCLDNRWITIKTDKSKRCPKASGWVETQLFDTDDITSNRTLENYCVYKKLSSLTPGSTTAIPKEIKSLIDAGYLEGNAERDCVVVASLASPSAAADVVAVLEKQLLSQTGKLELPPISPEVSPVRLALLDTLPTAEHSPQSSLTRSPHGASLAEIAQKLLCDQITTSCYANLTSQLALAYVAEIRDGEYFTFRDDYQGGFFGSITDLSLAIQKELQAWQEKAPSSRLIINLSLGWNGHSWGGHDSNPAKFSAAVKSVYDSIVNAVCRGAIVISAAGNKSKSELTDYEAMLPALWEELPRPSAEECYTLTGVSAEKREQRYDHKDPQENREKESETHLTGLVYGVSGIDSLGNPLSNSRPRANARIVAFGDHAAIKNTLATNTEVLTGSSVSTVVVSATASMIWSHRPELSAEQVMDLIFSAGEQLNIKADFYSGVSSRPLLSRRASMCRSLAYACKDGSCIGPADCQWTPALIDLNGTSIFTNPANDVFELAELASCSSTKDADCSVIEHGSVATTPWTMPQPDSEACPNCLKSNMNKSLVMQSSSSYSGEISDVNLVINDQIYTIPDFSLGDKIVISDLTPEALNSPTYLSFLVNDSYREWVPILLTE